MAPRPAVRPFSSMLILRKDEDKSNQALKNLGLSLQKGNLKQEEEPASTTELINLAVDPESDRIQQAYETIAYMTTDDITIQKGLDQGSQFNTFPSEHYLDRKQIIRNLPDEIDVFETPMAEIKHVYEQLARLDDDRLVQLKYFKRYLKNYDDPVIQLLQRFNKINDKFKLLRRREVDNLALAPNAFLYKENLCNVPYNVLGFDRSITGLPLRSGKHQLDDKPYPQEFIEDLQMFRTKIPLHKRDLNFIEIEEHSATVDPNKLGRGSSKYELHKFVNSIFEELEFPKNALYVNNIENYHNLEVVSTFLINEIDYEILQFKKTLQKEIEMFMASNGSKLLVFGHQDLKPNQFKLVDNNRTKEKRIQNFGKLSSLAVVTYFKNFNMIPPFALLLDSRRQYRKLRKHLFKVFLINLEDQIDTLFRIKYYNQPKMRRFMASVKTKIGALIDAKLMPICHDKRLKKLRGVDALIHKPNKDLAFKRLYWLDNKYRREVQAMRRVSFNVNHEDFNSYILRQVSHPTAP